MTFCGSWETLTFFCPQTIVFAICGTKKQVLIVRNIPIERGGFDRCWNYFPENVTISRGSVYLFVKKIRQLKSESRLSVKSQKLILFLNQDDSQDWFFQVHVWTSMTRSRHSASLIETQNWWTFFWTDPGLTTRRNNEKTMQRTLIVRKLNDTTSHFRHKIWQSGKRKARKLVWVAITN